MSMTPIFTDEAVKEITEGFTKASSYLNPRGGFYNSPFTTTAQRVVIAMTGD